MRRTKQSRKNTKRQDTFRKIVLLSSGQASILGFPVQKLYTLADQILDFLFKIARLFYVIPFTREDGGLIILGSLRRRVIFWAVFAIGLITMLHKAYVVASLLRKGDLNLETLLCACCLLIQLTGFCVSMASTFKPQETADVVNSWGYVMEILSTMHGRKDKAVDEIASAILIVMVMALISGVTIAVAMAVMLFPGLGVWILVKVVVARDGGPWLLPAWIWKLLLTPFELMFFVPPMCAGAFNGCIIMVSSGVLRMFACEIRKLRVNNLLQRRKVERLFVCFDLHSTVFNTWLRFTVPPVIFSLFCAIVLTTYASLRHTELPFYLYIFFPFTGAASMLFIFLLSYHAQLIITTIDGVAASLTDHQAKDVKEMLKADRINVIKKAKAFRPFKILLGPFGKFSLAFPVDVWEEVINQVLFLLSF